MGALADLQTQALSFGPQSPLGTWVKSELKKRADASVPAVAAGIASVHSLADSSQTSGGMTLKFGIRQPTGLVEFFTTAAVAWDLVSGVAVDAVHVIATDATDHTGGDFKITVLFASGETFTTAAVAYNATAATLETALDVAATAASITGWVNGHISVSASTTDLQDGTLTLTFDGTSVDELPSHPLTVMSDDSRTGGVSAATLTSNGTVCVQASIDIAAAAAGTTGFSPGDIVVTGTSVNTGPLTFTYGDLRQHAIPVLVNVDGAGGSWGAPSITTAGQSARAAWGVLVNLGVITASLPEQSVDASQTAVTKGADTVSIPDVIVKALMREAAAEDVNNNSYFSLQAALMPQDRAPLVEPIGAESVLPS